MPQRLTRKLQQVIGAEATEDLVNLLTGAELQRGELAAWREGMRADFAEFRSAIHTDIATFQAATRADIATSQDRVRQDITTLAARVEQVKSDLMKWSFLFWVGAVGAIAALAGVLR